MVLRPHMRNSTGSPVFSDFQSDLSRVAVSRPLVKGNEDAGYEGGPKPVCTPWPYGWAGDSAGNDQRVDRPGHDGQTLCILNIERVDADTKCGSCIHQFQ